MNINQSGDVVIVFLHVDLRHISYNIQEIGDEIR